MLGRLGKFSLKTCHPKDLVKYVEEAVQCKNPRHAKNAIRLVISEYPMKELLKDSRKRSLCAVLVAASKISYQPPPRWEATAFDVLTKSSGEYAGILASLLVSCTFFKSTDRMIPNLLSKIDGVFWLKKTLNSQRMALIHSVVKIKTSHKQHKLLCSNTITILLMNSSNHKDIINHEVASGIVWAHSNLYTKPLFSPCRDWIQLYRVLLFSKKPQFMAVKKFIQALSSYNFKVEEKKLFESIFESIASTCISPELRQSIATSLNTSPSGSFYNEKENIPNYKEISWLLERLVKANFLNMEILLLICRILEIHSSSAREMHSWEAVSILKGLLFFNYCPQSVKIFVAAPILRISDMKTMLYSRKKSFIVLDDLFSVLSSLNKNKTHIHSQVEQLVSSNSLVVSHRTERHLSQCELWRRMPNEIIIKYMLTRSYQGTEMLIRELYLVGWVHRKKYSKKLISLIYEVVFREGKNILLLKELSPRSCRELLLPLAAAKIKYQPLLEKISIHLLGVRNKTLNSIPIDYNPIQLLWCYVRVSWLYHKPLMTCLSGAVRQKWSEISKSEKYDLLSLLESFPKNKVEILQIFGKSAEYR